MRARITKPGQIQYSVIDGMSRVLNDICKILAISTVLAALQHSSPWLEGCRREACSPSVVEESVRPATREVKTIASVCCWTA